MKRDNYTLTLAGRLEDMKARENYPLDDIGKGRLFAELFKDRHRYNATAGEWGFFDGLAWKDDAHGLKAEKDAQVLADAGVYKQTPEGREAMLRFLASLGYQKA